jgi:hypothetical protein
MAHQSPIRNPFMMMLNPEIVLAAIENSEHLSQLNRHLCRPLDRPVVPNAQPAGDASVEDDDTDLADDSLDQ